MRNELQQRCKSFVFICFPGTSCNCIFIDKDNYFWLMHCALRFLNVTFGDKNRGIVFFGLQSRKFHILSQLSIVNLFVDTVFNTF